MNQMDVKLGRRMRPCPDVLVIDAAAPRGTVTEAFAWLMTAFGVGSAASAALAGLAGDADGVHAAFAVAGVGVLLALLITAIGGPIRDSRRPRSSPSVP